jgi:hypothetical protein
MAYIHAAHPFTSTLLTIHVPPTRLLHVAPQCLGGRRLQSLHCGRGQSTSLVDWSSEKTTPLSRVAPERGTWTALWT